MTEHRQDFNQSQSIIHAYLPDYLFTDEKNAQNHTLDYDTNLSVDETSSVDLKDLKEQEHAENELKFSCSTPIKFYVDDEQDLNSNHEAQSESTSTTATSSPKQKDDSGNEVNLVEAEKPTEKPLKEEFYNYSLLEFEENEKKANQNNSSKMTDSSFRSSLKAPINQMENLLSNLRSNYNYKNNLADNPGMQVRKGQSSFSTRKPAIEPMANKIVSTDQQLIQVHAETHDAVKQKQQQAPYFRKTDQLVALESRLENEIFRRQHCEKQILELNENLLELQQQLAVANGLDKKRELFAQNMDISIQKVTTKSLRNFETS